MSTPPCNCDIYYYDVGVANCAACHHKCKTCENSPTNCTGSDCRGDRVFADDCKCPDGKYDDGTSDDC